MTRRRAPSPTGPTTTALAVALLCGLATLVACDDDPAMDRNASADVSPGDLEVDATAADGLDAPGDTPPADGSGDSAHDTRHGDTLADPGADLHVDDQDGSAPVAPLRVAIYVWDGASAEHLLAVFRALSSAGFEVAGVGYWDVLYGRIASEGFDVLVLPEGEGGSPAGYRYHLGGTDLGAALTRFVHSGGGVVGIEAGAWFLASNGGGPQLWGGAYAPWVNPVPGVYGFDRVDATVGEGTLQAWMGAGGGTLMPDGATTVAARNVFGEAVAVVGASGAGRVALTSLSPALRADSWDDWTAWDNWDAGSAHADSTAAWLFLARLVAWAGGLEPDAVSLAAGEPSGAPVAIVASHAPAGGAWPGLLPAVARAVAHSGRTPVAIRFGDPGAGRLTVAAFETVVFSGGNAAGYYDHVDAASVRAFVEAGGGYLGICAGAYYAADRVGWEGDIYDYPLDLFPGLDAGPLAGIAPWPTWTLVPVAVEDPALGGPYVQQQLYFGGGHKVVDADQASRVTAVARYRCPDDAACATGGLVDAVRLDHGQGRVLLVGTHPESLAGSNEDWLYWDGFDASGTTAVANSDDPWAFVDGGLGWLAGP